MDMGFLSLPKELQDELVAMAQAVRPFGDRPGGQIYPCRDPLRDRRVPVTHSPEFGNTAPEPADHLDELARHAAEHNLYELTAEPRDMR